MDEVNGTGNAGIASGWDEGMVVLLFALAAAEAVEGSSFVFAFLFFLDMTAKTSSSSEDDSSCCGAPLRWRLMVDLHSGFHTIRLLHPIADRRSSVVAVGVNSNSNNNKRINSPNFKKPNNASSESLPGAIVLIVYPQVLFVSISLLCPFSKTVRGQ
jgi:hypothetical protein